MAEVSFYILPSQSQEERYLFACKLIEKTYHSGSFCYVLTDTSVQSQRLDDLLWTFRLGSFIPHQVFIDNVPTIKQVLIGSQPPPAQWQNTVLNLSTQCTDAQRVLEILDSSEETKSAGRVRYRHYQQAGYTLTTHKKSSLGWTIIAS